MLNKLFRIEDTGLNLTIRDQPIHEDETQAKQAMDETANTLRMVRFEVRLEYVNTNYLNSKAYRSGSEGTRAPFVVVAMSAIRLLYHHLQLQR